MPENKPYQKVLKITEYLNFTEFADNGKTKQIGIGNNSGEKLALIKWNGGWRKYCLYPFLGTCFDVKCLEEITDFISELMLNRKN